MTLDESDLKNGLRFIVGTWRPDYVVSMFSNDLAHIPAADFKTDDGSDLTALCFVFTEDHAVKAFGSPDGKEYGGKWEQTGWSDYKLDLDAFDEIPEGPFKEGVRSLSVQDGRLVLGLAFLAIAFMKTEEGVVTEEPDVGDLTPSETDLAMKDIVGRYAVARTNFYDGENFEMLNRDEAAAALEKMIAGGQIEAAEAGERLGSVFDTVTEFTDDYKVKTWMPLPASVSEDDVRAALESGEIEEVSDGMFLTETKEWKAVNGKYYYNTEAHREIFGEVKSPWDELAFDENGLLPFGDGWMLLEKI